MHGAVITIPKFIFILGFYLSWGRKVWKRKKKKQVDR